MNHKHNKFTRALAWLGIIALVCLFINMVYCAFTGKNFMGSLYLVIIVPTVIWGGIVIFRHFGHKNDFFDDEEDSSSSK